MTIKQPYPFIESFSDFNLEELSKANLLERKDNKYVFGINQLFEVLSSMTKTHDILKINDDYIFDYHTDYFDTEDFQFYRKHHNKQYVRIKARFRTYLNDNTQYAELKYKNNKQITSKERFLIEELGSSEKKLLESITDLDLEKKCSVQYSRYTFLNKKRKEKVTIDIGLTVSNGEKEVKLADICIAELKTFSFYDSEFKKIMSDLRFKPISMSKYCIAISYLNPDIKQNNFKEKIRLIEKISSENKSVV